MTDTATAMSDLQKLAILRRSLDLMNRSETVAAETALLGLLNEFPEEPDALQLLGVLRRVQGRGEEAEALYRRSLAANPEQPQVHHNLGNLLYSIGRTEEAIAAQREALRLKPNYVEAHLNLGLALLLAGDFAAAEQSFRAALRIQPNYVFAKQSLATALTEQKRPKEAETLLRQTLALGSRDPRQLAALEHNLGVAVKMQGRFEEALRLFDAAQTKVPDLVMVDYNRGNALQQLGFLEEAVASYRRALGRNPLDMNAHRDLNALLYRLGRDSEFLRSYDEVAALYPDVGALPLDKGQFLFLKEDFDGAEEEFRRAVRLKPDDVMPHDGLGLILARKGEFDAAITEHETAVRMEPTNVQAWRNFSRTLVRAGDAKKAIEAAERALAIEPDDQGSLALWSVALRAQGDSRDDALNDYENFVQVFELEPPEGYADMEAFNQDLNAYLDRLHRDKRECIDQTLRGGTQTLDNLFGKGHLLVERLRARIDEAVNAYIAKLGDDDAHPLLRRRRDEFKYAASWSSRLHDCGFHTNHVHPKGWISSAYYIALPDAVADAKTREGWIQFGAPDFEAGLQNPVRRVERPVPGKLVLFPSYMWHGTVPFHSQQSRTTIAFDVVPR
jgi:tetratricopeptide (TPR) repeat protein